MSDLFWLSDEAWTALSPHLPKNRPGARRVDDRRVISGILHVLKAGCPWHALPSNYGPAKTVYNRYRRWAQRRIWQRIFAGMAARGPIPQELAIPSTYVKAQRSAKGSKGGPRYKPLAPLVAEEQAKSISWPMIVDQSPLR